MRSSTCGFEMHVKCCCTAKTEGQVVPHAVAWGSRQGSMRYCSVVKASPCAADPMKMAGKAPCSMPDHEAHARHGSRKRNPYSLFPVYFFLFAVLHHDR
jgi:hypothetical protein